VLCADVVKIPHFQPIRSSLYNIGFDGEGSESFWTVTGDNVTSLAFVDVDSDGVSELLVGSDDFEIRIFKHEELVGEITEADKVTLLTAVQGNKFAYGLANGTVGVYNGAKARAWRVKTKNAPTAILAMDFNADGFQEIITGTLFSRMFSPRLLQYRGQFS